MSIESSFDGGRESGGISDVVIFEEISVDFLDSL